MDVYTHTNFELGVFLNCHFHCKFGPENIFYLLVFNVLQQKDYIVNSSSVSFVPVMYREAR